MVVVPERPCATVNGREFESESGYGWISGKGEGCKVQTPKYIRNHGSLAGSE